MEEIEAKAPLNIYRILMMTRVLKYNRSEASAELSQGISTDVSHLLGQDYYNKLKVIVQEFEKRNWLKE